MFTNLPYLAAFVPYNIVPISELYAWSNNQKIHILFHKIAELVKATNDYDKIFEELKGLLNDFDDEMKKQLEELLQKMYEDGSLSDLIGDIVSDSLKGKSGNIDLSHMAFVTHISHNYQDNSTTSYNEQLYSYAQGNNVFKINGTKYWVVCATRQNTTQNDQADDGCDVYVYRFNDNGDMYFVTKRNYNAIGHANGCCYYNGYIYITPNSYATGDNAGLTTDIHRISFDGTTLGLIQQTKTIPFDYSGAWVDFPTVYNNELYMVDKFMNVIKYDWDSNTYDIIYNEINGSKGYSGEGLSIDDNFIYFMESANYKLKRYNKALGEVDWVYQLPQVSNNRMYKTGEIEGFTIKDGVLYVLGAYNMGQTILINSYNIWHFYRQNLATNNISPTNSFGGWSSGITGNGGTFYVDGELPRDTDDPINPNGLGLNTLENPNRAFPSLQHALDFIGGNEWIKKASIQVCQDYNYSPIVVKSNKSITISGTYYMNTHSSKIIDSETGNEKISVYRKPVVGQLYLLKCSNIQIDNIAIENRLPNALYDGNSNHNISVNVGDFLNNCIRIDDCSEISLTDIYFPTGLETNHKYVIYALNVSRSTVNLRVDMNIYFDETTSGAMPTPFYAWKVYREQLIPTPQSPIKYCNTYNCSVNTHRAIEYLNNRDGDYRNYYISDGIINIHNADFIG